MKVIDGDLLPDIVADVEELTVGVGESCAITLLYKADNSRKQARFVTDVSRLIFPDFISCVYAN